MYVTAASNTACFSLWGTQRHLHRSIHIRTRDPCRRQPAMSGAYRHLTKRPASLLRDWLISVQNEMKEYDFQAMNRLTSFPFRRDLALAFEHCAANISGTMCFAATCRAAEQPLRKRLRSPHCNFRYPAGRVLANSQKVPKSATLRCVAGSFAWGRRPAACRLGRS